jgi:Ni,Fe-hydrogenase III small subunit
MSGYSAEQIRGCRCSSRPQVILSVGECKIASERFHDSSALGTCIGRLSSVDIMIGKHKPTQRAH